MKVEPDQAADRQWERPAASPRAERTPVLVASCIAVLALVTTMVILIVTTGNPNWLRLVLPASFCMLLGSSLYRAQHQASGRFRGWFWAFAAVMVLAVVAYTGMLVHDVMTHRAA